MACKCREWYSFHFRVGIVQVWTLQARGSSRGPPAWPRRSRRRASLLVWSDCRLSCSPYWRYGPASPLVGRSSGFLKKRNNYFVEINTKNILVYFIYFISIWHPRNRNNFSESYLTFNDGVQEGQFGMWRRVQILIFTFVLSLQYFLVQTFLAMRKYKCNSTIDDAKEQVLMQ